MLRRISFLAALAAASFTCACNLIFQVDPGQPTGGTGGTGTGGSGASTSSESSGGSGGAGATGGTGGTGGMTTGGTAGTGGGTMCTPGAASCEGAVLHACDANGQPLADVTCDAPAACDAAAKKCIDAASIGRLSVGWGRACAIEDDHKVRCWGFSGGGAILKDPPDWLPTAHPVPNSLEARQIAAGGDQICGLQDDGTVKCWGTAEAGDTGFANDGLQIPMKVPGVEHAVEVSASYRCSCARLSDGTVWCWGQQESGCFGVVPAGTGPQPVPTQVPGVTDAVQLRIGTGDEPSCVRQLSGKVVCWSVAAQAGTTIKPSPIPDVEDALDVAVGFAHVFIRSKQKGLLWSAPNANKDGWLPAVSYVDGDFSLIGAGSSFCGVDGNGLLVCSDFTQGLQPDIPSAVMNPPQGAIAELAVGWGRPYGHDLQCIRMAGQPLSTGVYCWGDDYGGALGAGAPEVYPKPVQVMGVTGVKALSTGQYSTSVTLSDGSVMLWGAAEALLDDTGTPQPVDFLGTDNVIARTNDVERVAYVLKQGGSAQLWDQQVSSPGKRLLASGFTDFVDLHEANHWDIGLRANGTVVVYSETDMGNVGGIFGDGTVTATPDEIKTVPGLSGVLQLAAFGADYDPSPAHACVRLPPSGSVSCWGANDFGQAGNGVMTPDPVTTPTPVPLPGGVFAKSIASGYRFSCAAATNGKVYCWGANYDGQLGVTGIDSSATPVEVAGITNAAGVTARENHACAWLDDKTVKCWGENDLGQLGNGSIGQPPTPVSVVSGLADVVFVDASQEHTCALHSNGAVSCWGSSYSGQIGTGVTGRFAAPQQVQGL
jgi:alpha-tubulin suppressor-like RCC1 family protein